LLAALYQARAVQSPGSYLSAEARPRFNGPGTVSARPGYRDVPFPNGIPALERPQLCPRSLGSFCFGQGTVYA
jgi:hypothetical protein